LLTLCNGNPSPNSTKTKRVDEVVVVLQDVVHVLKLPGSDVSWSHYKSAEEAVQDIHQHIARLQEGDFSKIDDLKLLFAPTGGLQEISVSSGWGESFLVLAAQFDRAIEAQRVK